MKVSAEFCEYCRHGRTAQRGVEIIETLAPSAGDVLRLQLERGFQRVELRLDRAQGFCLIIDILALSSIIVALGSISSGVTQEGIIQSLKLLGDVPIRV